MLNLDTNDARVPLLRPLMDRCHALVRLMAAEADTSRNDLYALRAVNQRSRPMIAVYPSGGSRYMRHVDNPDGNGRLLTVLFCNRRGGTEPEAAQQRDAG